MASSHTFDRSKFPLPALNPSSLSTPKHASSTLKSRTPPPSPSPFMRSFYGSSQPPTQSQSQSSSTPLTYRTFLLQSLRRIWREERRHFRRFLLIVVLILLPTLLIAAYFVAAAGGAVAYRNHPVDAPMSGRGPIAVMENPNVAVAQGRGGGIHGRIHKRRGAQGLVPRQELAAASSSDSADAPVLSLGNGLGSGTTTPRATTSADANSNSVGILTGTPTTTLRTTTTTAPSVPSDPILPTPFVQPFDTTLSTDFVSGTCQVFFSTFTQSLSFRQCRPFSLLLPTSQDFITAQSNLTLLTSILYGTCTTTPSADECTGRMNDLSGALRAACGAELGAGHALAWDALNGMKNYQMMRDAGCLRNLRTNAYCFADALAAAQPSDIYFYQLPLGTPLPGALSTSSATSSSAAAASTQGTTKVNTVVPTCSACTQSLMAIYAGYATNSSLLISGTYDSAQRLVDTTCGSGYASAISGAAAAAVAAPALRGAVVFSAVLSLGMVSLSLGAL